MQLLLWIWNTAGVQLDCIRLWNHHRQWHSDEQQCDHYLDSDENSNSTKMINAQ